MSGGRAALQQPQRLAARPGVVDDWRGLVREKKTSPGETAAPERRRPRTQTSPAHRSAGTPAEAPHAATPHHPNTASRPASRTCPAVECRLTVGANCRRRLHFYLVNFLRSTCGRPTLHFLLNRSRRLHDLESNCLRNDYYLSDTTSRTRPLARPPLDPSPQPTRSLTPPTKPGSCPLPSACRTRPSFFADRHVTIVSLVGLPT